MCLGNSALEAEKCDIDAKRASVIAPPAIDLNPNLPELSRCQFKRLAETFDTPATGVGQPR